MLRFLAVLSCISLVFCIQHPLVAEQVHHDDFQAEQARDLLKHVLGNAEGDVYELKEGELGFSWDNCGSGSDVIQVKSLSVGPDPIVIPGNVNVSLDAAIAQDITAPSSLKLVIKKKVFGFYVEVPCVDNLGSCTYSSPCDLLKNITCPEIFKEHGFTCRCPIKKNEYKLPASIIAIPDIKLPSFIENGDYDIQATLMQGSERLGCYHIKASLAKKSSVHV